MTTAVLAWLTVAAACTAAVLFGQTARTAPRRSSRPRLSTRIGLVLSMSGPWAAVILAAVGGAVTGQWLSAAVAALLGVLVVAFLGLILAPQ